MVCDTGVAEHSLCQPMGAQAVFRVGLVGILAFGGAESVGVADIDPIVDVLADLDAAV